MAKITREQVKKYNDKMGNGFQFDLERFLVWGEKRAVKRINLAKGDFLECIIQYQDYTNWRTGYQKDLRIEIVTRVWNPTASGCYSNSTGSRYCEHSKGYEKQLFKKIQEITFEIDDNAIFEIEENGKKTW